MKLTVVSCIYYLGNDTVINHKRNFDYYITWMKKFLLIVKIFNLVIFTDKLTYEIIKKNKLNEIIEMKNDKIKVIFKEKEEFFGNRYKNYLKKNQKKINFNDGNAEYSKLPWELNLIWFEKINFVRETIENKYFDTEYYAWCDIGYFRNESNGDLELEELLEWGNNIQIIDNNRNKNKIFYGSPYNDFSALNKWCNIVKFKNKDGLPIINNNATNDNTCPRSISGNFFLLHKDKINWWFNTFYSMFYLHIKYNRIVYHDETILSICVALYPEHFKIFIENNPRFTNTWRLFQRYLIKGYY